MLNNTDSFCERCGTRYPFHANASRTLSLKGARVLAKGLKNFVLTDGQSLNDSMTLAREADEHEITTRMTEAFHRTFNFCMTCRQYACDKCWNPQQGACLTCAPEAGLGPVEPEDHLIVRTPVARGDNDWALFPDILGSAGEPAAEAPPALSAWPVQDLRVSAREAGSDSAGSHEPLVRQSDDREAWSVWPIADEIAPEMTLTPAEMVLIEAQLAQEEAVEGSSAAHETAPPEVLPDLPEVEPSVLPSPTPAEEPVVEPVFAEMAPPPSPSPAEERVPAIARFLGRFSLRGDSSLRRPASASPRTPRPSEPGSAPWPHATEWSRRPIQAHDWFSDASPTVAEPETAQVEETYAAATLAPQPAEPEAVLATSAAESSDEVSSAPAPVTGAERSVDFVEPLRAAAMPPGPPLPFYEPIPVASGQQTLFDGAPASDFTSEQGAESAAQPDAHPEVAEVAPEPAPPLATPEPAPPLAAASPTVPLEAPPLYRAPQAPAAWPPIGASWPARETPGAPWPGPEAPSVPAAVAAREAALPVLAGMWAQSAQEVLSRGSVRVCHHCALPVSTQARFCRRCGTKQA